MPFLILARHGRSTANAAGVLAGREPGVSLDDRGREQAIHAAGRLSSVTINRVVSSPLQRCRETSQLLMPAMTAMIDDQWTECDYGTWTGGSLTTLAKEPLWRLVQRQPSAATFPDGESLREMSTRAVAAARRLNEALAQEIGDHSVGLVVSHGDVIKAVLADALGMHLDAFQRITVSPASLSVIYYGQQRAAVLAMNTVAGDLPIPHHIPEEAVVGGDLETPLGSAP